MALYESVVPARYATPLIRLLHQQDATAAAAVLDAAGLQADQLRDPEVLLDFAQFDSLFAGLARLAGREDLGFDLGLALDRASHGVLGLAFGRCTCVGDLLMLAARHSRLMTPSLVLEFRRKANTGELRWRPAAGMSAVMLHGFYDIHVVSLYRLLGDLLGDRLLPYDAVLPIVRPRHAGRYRTLPRLRVSFVPQPLPEVCTHLPSELLRMPLAERPDEGSAIPDAAMLAALGHRFGRSHGWSDWLHLMLREANGVQPTQAELARLLNVSAHTLARNLAKEGQRFRRIASAVRHQRACELLRGSTFDVAQIALRLGYGHSSNFIHAFRRIEGMSPARYRERSKVRISGDRP